LLGLRPAAAVAISAALRGSYHLHQGFGPFFGNVVMGVIFGTLFIRWRRTNPMIIAHTLVNSVAFIGYTLLAGTCPGCRDGPRRGSGFIRCG